MRFGSEDVSSARARGVEVGDARKGVRGCETRARAGGGEVRGVRDDGDGVERVGGFRRAVSRRRDAGAALFAVQPGQRRVFSS